MNGKDLLTGIGHLIVDLVEYPTGRLGGGWDSRAHGLQAVVELIGRNICRVDLAFRELDIQGGLSDIHGFKFFGRQVSSTIGDNFHIQTHFQDIFAIISDLEE